MTLAIEGFFKGTGMPDADWWEALWPDPAAVIEAVGVRPGMAVVDLCCGDGWFTLPIAACARYVTGIDIDPALLDVARERLDGAGAANCTLFEADAYDLHRCVTDPVDHVLLANAFHGVPDQPRLLAAVRESLAPGGLFAVVNWHELDRAETAVLGQPRGPATEMRMPCGVTVEVVEAAGLLHEGTIEVSPFHYGALFRRDR
ncbi:hypothetical protein GCM10008171_33700 [Methylopila jiangsuensis]|uniref:Methyltransferase domain-containing protein n=1 Tax=Methylopila jiangsuensis TaxID=586230 RepID=A0A9W6N5C6_9HYPH|nr:class I SAM-dependent methyltransferase [Methylopila jiangsuensis]MDR6284495.1 SAM-dependent methyltransferase [Methylopila jiangsuensis]GLK78116.1 hypothetical protein GCM10008171_33700 [Methylopila jiangsuensis]